MDCVERTKGGAVMLERSPLIVAIDWEHEVSYGSKRSSGERGARLTPKKSLSAERWLGSLVAIKGLKKEGREKGLGMLRVTSNIGKGE